MGVAIFSDTAPGREGGRTAITVGHTLQARPAGAAMISAAPEIRELLGPIRRIHERVRDAVVAECEKAAVEQLAEVSDDESGEIPFTRLTVSVKNSGRIVRA